VSGMLLFDSNVILGWSYSNEYYWSNPTADWTKYTAHNLIIITLVTYVIFSLSSDRIKKTNHIILCLVYENATCLFNSKYKSTPISIRIISTIIFLTAFFLFFVTNYNSLSQLLSELISGVNTWGYISLSHYNWHTMLSGFTIFAVGSFTVNKLLNLNTVAYRITYVSFILILTALSYNVASVIFALITTDSITSQPVGIPSHTGLYINLIISIPSIGGIISMFIALHKNKKIFIKSS